MCGRLGREKGEGRGAKEQQGEMEMTDQKFGGDREQPPQVFLWDISLYSAAT